MIATLSTTKLKKNKKKFILLLTGVAIIATTVLIKQAKGETNE